MQHSFPLRKSVNFALITPEGHLTIGTLQFCRSIWVTIFPQNSKNKCTNTATWAQQSDSCLLASYELKFCTFISEMPSYLRLQQLQEAYYSFPWPDLVSVVWGAEFLTRAPWLRPLATAPGYSAGAGADSVACWLAVARRSGRQSWSAWWQICRCSRVAMLLLMMMTCLLWWTARLQHVARRHRLTASQHSSLLDLMSHNF